MHLKSKDSRDARKEQLTYFLRAINAELENMDPSTIVICGADLNDEHDVYARIFVQYGYEAGCQNYWPIQGTPSSTG